MKIFIFLIMLFFSLFGFSEFLHLIKLKVIFPKRKMCSQLMLILQNDTAEQQLTFACEQLNWYGDKFADMVFADCKNLDEITYIRCQEIANRYGVKLIR